MTKGNFFYKLLKNDILFAINIESLTVQKWNVIVKIQFYSKEYLRGQNEILFKITN